MVIMKAENGEISGWKRGNRMVSEDRGGSSKERSGFRIQRYKFKVQQCDLSQVTLEKSQFSDSKCEVVPSGLRTHCSLSQMPCKCLPVIIWITNTEAQK